MLESEHRPEWVKHAAGWVLLALFVFCFLAVALLARRLIFGESSFGYANVFPARKADAVSDRILFDRLQTRMIRELATNRYVCGLTAVDYGYPVRMGLVPLAGVNTLLVNPAIFLSADVRYVNGERTTGDQDPLCRAGMAGYRYHRIPETLTLRPQDQVSTLELSGREARCVFNLISRMYMNASDSWPCELRPGTEVAFLS